MKVELDREDWELAKEGAISLLKNAMAQTIVYQGQLEVAERELKKFPQVSKESSDVASKIPIGVK